MVNGRVEQFPFLFERFVDINHFLWILISY